MLNIIIKLLLFVTILLVPVSTSLHAQDNSALAKPIYYVAGDENNVQQVFQLLLGSDQDARQITHAATDVFRYGVAYDSLSIVYVSDGQLWLQPIHAEEAEALASIDTTNLWTKPIFSQDGNYAGGEASVQLKL